MPRDFVHTDAHTFSRISAPLFQLKWLFMWQMKARVPTKHSAHIDFRQTTRHTLTKIPLGNSFQHTVPFTCILRSTVRCTSSCSKIAWFDRMGEKMRANLTKNEEFIGTCSVAFKLISVFPGDSFYINKLANNNNHFTRKQ